MEDSSACLSMASVILTKFDKSVVVFLLGLRNRSGEFRILRLEGDSTVSRVLALLERNGGGVGRE